MDEKTTEQVGVFLKMVNESLQSGKDFVLEQAPLVVQEMVLFGRVYYTTCMVISLLIVVGCVCGLRVVYAKSRETSDPDFVMIMSSMVSVLPFLGGGALASGCLGPMLMAWFAPRLYVLDQVASMLK